MGDLGFKSALVLLLVLLMFALDFNTALVGLLPVSATLVDFGLLFGGLGFRRAGKEVCETRFQLLWVLNCYRFEVVANLVIQRIVPRIRRLDSGLFSHTLHRCLLKRVLTRLRFFFLLFCLFSDHFEQVSRVLRLVEFACVNCA